MFVLPVTHLAFRYKTAGFGPGARRFREPVLPPNLATSQSGSHVLSQIPVYWTT